MILHHPNFRSKPEFIWPPLSDCRCTFPPDIPELQKLPSASHGRRNGGSDDDHIYGGQARIRTLEARRQQIYSLPPLATWVPDHESVTSVVPTRAQADDNTKTPLSAPLQPPGTADWLL